MAVAAGESHGTRNIVSSHRFSTTGHLHLAEHAGPMF
jgi:hypothetical protein